MECPRKLLAATTAALHLAACRTPTQVTVELSTDVSCDLGTKTTLRVGSPGQEAEGRLVALETTACASKGRIGSAVVSPGGSKDDGFARKPVLPHGCRTPGTEPPADRCPSACLARRQ